MSDNVNGVKVVTWMGIAFLAYTLITVIRGVVDRCEENEVADNQYGELQNGPNAA